MKTKKTFKPNKKFQLWTKQIDYNNIETHIKMNFI